MPSHPLTVCWSVGCSFPTFTSLYLVWNFGILDFLLIVESLKTTLIAYAALFFFFFHFPLIIHVTSLMLTSCKSCFANRPKKRFMRVSHNADVGKVL